MAMGGGLWQSQNKALPGGYINFVSAARATAAPGTRGTAALPLVMDWGPEQEMISMTAAEFWRGQSATLGYALDAEALRPLRELFLHSERALLCRVNGGTRAANSLATARCSGSRGNALSVVVTAEGGGFTVKTLLDGAVADTQNVTGTTDALQDNDYLCWKPGVTLTATVGMALSGGTTAAATTADYQGFLDRLESYSFHTLGLPSTQETLKTMFAQFTGRMRDETGVKFQCVLYRYAGAGYEGVISVDNSAAGDESGLVCWVTGAEAGCALNASLTNSVYDGEHDVNVDYTQAALETALADGRFVFHRAADGVRVLADRNSYTGGTEGKSADFGKNQVVRVLDQIGHDVAAMFNAKYVGQVPNDNAGRISLWGDIVAHHKGLEQLRAIEAFDSSLLKVTAAGKNAVLVEDRVTPVCALEQLYMTVIVE